MYTRSVVHDICALGGWGGGVVPCRMEAIREIGKDFLSCSLGGREPFIL